MQAEQAILPLLETLKNAKLIDMNLEACTVFHVDSHRVILIITMDIQQFRFQSIAFVNDIEKSIFEVIEIHE